MRTRRVVLAAVGLAALLIVGITIRSCGSTPKQYVALGDSYTSGVAIRDADGAPSGCFRSSHDYPQLVRDRLDAGGAGDFSLVDVSCGGATVVNVYAAQKTFDGTNRPQIEALHARTKIVTIGIGANDIDFSDFMQACIVQPVAGGCRARYVHGKDDKLRDHIDTLRPKIVRLINDVHARAPDAQVSIVGYPTILPADGNCPALHAASDDITYLHGVFTDLNTMLQAQAKANRAHFIDTATSSVGHDMCAAHHRWINGTKTGKDSRGRPDGAPGHPNFAGTTHTARAIAAAIKAQLDD